MSRYYESYSCGRCGRPVSQEVASCPHCGVQFAGTRFAGFVTSGNSEGGASGANAGKPTKRRVAVGIGFVALLVVGIGAAIYFAASNSSSEEDTPSQQATPSVTASGSPMLSGPTPEPKQPGADPTPLLMERLSHNDPAERARAAEELGKQTPPVRNAVPALLRAVGDAHEEVRSAAAEALRKIGLRTSADLEALTDAGNDRNRLVRLHVAEALGRGEQEGKQAVPLLLALAKDTDAEVRRAALRALERCARTERPSVLSAFVEALEDADNECCQIATDALKRLAPAKPGDLPVLRAAMARKNGSVRLFALQSLGQLGPVARTAMAELRAALNDSDPDVRQAAMTAVGRVEVQQEELLAVYLKGLKDANEQVRGQAADGLGDMGSAARPANAPLAEALADEAPVVRLKAADALQKIDPAAVVPALTSTLQSKHVAARKDAAEALGRLGPTARAGAGALAAAVVDTSSEVRQVAGEALRRVDSSQVPSAYAEALRNESADIRREAVQALVRLGTEARPVATAIQDAILRETDVAVRVKLCKAHWRLEQRPGAVCKALMEALKDDEETTRAEAAEALALIGPEARDAVDALLQAIKDRHLIVRQHAIAALGSIGPAARTAIPRLGEALRDEALCLLAATALGKIGKASVSVLSEALEDKSPLVRRHAATALGTIGPDAADAVRSLNFLQYKDKDGDVRAAAAEALRKIRPK